MQVTGHAGLGGVQGVADVGGVGDVDLAGHLEPGDADAAAMRSSAVSCSTMS